MSLVKPLGGQQHEDHGQSGTACATAATGEIAADLP